MYILGKGHQSESIDILGVGKGGYSCRTSRSLRSWSQTHIFWREPDLPRFRRLIFFHISCAFWCLHAISASAVEFLEVTPILRNFKKKSGVLMKPRSEPRRGVFFVSSFSPRSKGRWSNWGHLFY